MSGTQKSILRKSNSKTKGKTQKRVRIHSPGNQIVEFKRDFGKNEVPLLWSNDQEATIARKSKEDNDTSKRSSRDVRKNHIVSRQLRENDVFHNRKTMTKDVARKARELFKITDVDSPVSNTTRKNKNLSRIVWEKSPPKPDLIRAAVSASQLEHSKSKNRISGPVPRKNLSETPSQRDAIKKRPVASPTLWERMFGK
jgi:hypothetical protein